MIVQPVDTCKRSERRTTWQIFRTPFWLGLLSIVGLLAALIGDGLLDALSWLGLGVPVVLSIWYGWWWPRRRG